jgi:hypothetical protein
VEDLQDCLSLTERKERRLFCLMPARIPAAAPISRADARVDIQAVIILIPALLAGGVVSITMARQVALAALGVDAGAAVVLGLA